MLGVVFFLLAIPWFNGSGFGRLIWGCQNCFFLILECWKRNNWGFIVRMAHRSAALCGLMWMQFLFEVFAKKPVWREMNMWNTLPETKSSPLKIGRAPKGNDKVFQPSISRCYVSFREGKINRYNLRLVVWNLSFVPESTGKLLTITFWRNSTYHNLHDMNAMRSWL